MTQEEVVARDRIGVGVGVLARAFVVPLLACVALVSCGEPEPRVCPDLATLCPDGCHGVTAMAYDETAACLQAPVVVGCTDRELASPMLECRKRLLDGELFLFLDLAPFGLTNWGECSEAEAGVVQPAMPCP